jgi:hypothetical protein
MARHGMARNIDNHGYERKNGVRVLIEMQGTTPLVLQNERLADPEDDFARRIKEITDKKQAQRTESDTRELETLEFLGSLYYDQEAGVHLPAKNIMRCLRNASASFSTTDAQKILNGFSVITDRYPINYEGPRDLATLQDAPEFRWRTLVKVKSARVPRVRPIFRRWSVTVEAEIAEDVLDLPTLNRYLERAGRSQGVGTARKLGYGRFSFELAGDGQVNGRRKHAT